MHNFARESRLVQDQLVALYANRRASDAERVKRGLAPLHRPALPATALIEPPSAPAIAEPARPAASPTVVPARPALTAADLEFERVRAAALARIAAERAEAAEIDKAVASILDSRERASGLSSAEPFDPNVTAILDAVRLASAS